MKDFNVFDLEEDRIERVMNLNDLYNKLESIEDVKSDLDFLKMIVDEGMKHWKKRLQKKQVDDAFERLFGR